MSRVVRIVQVMRDSDSGPVAINDNIRSITFQFDAEGQVVSKTAEPVRETKHAISYIPWDWRNAQSLLSTRDWLIVADRDTTADIPQTISDELEGGAW
jgi:hypothetical protein